MENGDDIKRDITERWLSAADFLIQNEKARSYKRLAEKIGLDGQRITMFKNFLNNNGRPTYVNVDHVYALIKFLKCP